MTEQTLTLEECKKILQKQGIVVRETMTRPTRAGKKPRPVWEISGNTDRIKHILYDRMKLRQWHGKFTAWEDPTEELVQAIEEEGVLSFAQTKEREREWAEIKAERLEERAVKHTQKSDQYYQGAKQISDFIPLGQPILVGHHSESRHRRDLARINQNMRKSVESDRYATHLTEQAQFQKSKAQGEHNAEYLGNRIQEVNAQIKECDRHLRSSD